MSANKEAFGQQELPEEIKLTGVTTEIRWVGALIAVKDGSFVLTDSQPINGENNQLWVHKEAVWAALGFHSDDLHEQVKEADKRQLIVRARSEFHVYDPQKVLAIIRTFHKANRKDSVFNIAGYMAISMAAADEVYQSEGPEPPKAGGDFIGTKG